MIGRISVRWFKEEARRRARSTTATRASPIGSTAGRSELVEGENGWKTMLLKLLRSVFRWKVSVSHAFRRFEVRLEEELVLREDEAGLREVPLLPRRCHGVELGDLAPFS